MLGLKPVIESKATYCLRLHSCPTVAASVLDLRNGDAEGKLSQPLQDVN